MQEKLATVQANLILKSHIWKFGCWLHLDCSLKGWSMITRYYRHEWDVLFMSVNVLVAGVIDDNKWSIDPLYSYIGFTSGFTSLFFPTCVKIIHIPVNMRWQTSVGVSVCTSGLHFCMCTLGASRRKLLMMASSPALQENTAWACWWWQAPRYPSWWIQARYPAC